MKFLPRGCGCALVIFLACAFIAAGAVLAIGISFRSTINELDTNPVPLPVPEITQEDEQRIEAIDVELDRMLVQGSAGSLIIPDRLINGWLRVTRAGHLRRLSEHSWVTLEGDRAVITLSLPLSMFGASDRYLTGEMALIGSLQDQHLSVRMLHFKAGKRSRILEILADIARDRELSDRLGIAEFLPAALMKRCDVAIQNSSLLVSCEAG